MKQHPIKNSSLRGVLFILLCIVGIGNVWGEEVTVTFNATQQGYSNAQEVTEITFTKGITATLSNSKYYNTGTAIRVYAGGTFTITSTIGNITKIKFTFGSGDGSNTISKNCGTYYSSSGTWSGSSESITFSIGGSSGHRRFQTIAVTYEKEAGAPTLSSLSISGTPTLTEYYVGDTPSAEGLVVTATYSDNSTEDVTASATWTFEPATIEKNTTSVKATANYQGESSSCTYDISIQSIANTEGTPYSVAEAYEHIDLGKGLVEEVYVKGMVSKVENYDVTSGTINYWISDDGTRIGQQFMCDGGLDIGNAKFNNINDLKLGTNVIVKGLLQKDGDTYKFATDNTIISKDESNAKTLSTIEINGTPTKNTYYVGDTPSAEGLTVTATYSDNSTDDVTEYVNWTFTPETIAESTTQIKATAEYHEVISEYEFEVNVYNKTIFYERIKDGKMYYIGATVGGTDYYFSTTYTTKDKMVSGVAQTEKSKGTIVKAIVNKNEKNKWAFQFDNGYYLSLSNEARNGFVKIAGEAAYWTLSNTANQLIKMYINGYCLQRNSISSNTIFGSYNDSQINVWFMEVPTHNISITSAGYATFCLPYNATVPQGLTAYTASDKGDYIKLTAKAGGKIAAGEGVVLKGEENTYTFVATAESVLPTEGNLMVGVTENTHLTATDNAYMLVRDKNSGEITFSLLNADYTLSANKAYLKLEENDARKQISTIWDDNGTGIDEILNTSTLNNNTIYNLSGQRLRQRQKGLNIIDGKLVIE